jgi:hypothetical protein
MNLEEKSIRLKEIVAVYDTQWFLGNLSGLMMNVATGRANDQLGRLSSPLRQLYFLGGLLITSSPTNGNHTHYSTEEWNIIIDLLVEIESEYDKIFFPETEQEISEDWKKVRMVAMPSFLSYFNQGPLNYEEQTINWVNDLYTQLDDKIESVTGLKTKDFVIFYNNLDQLVQNNFQAHTTKKQQLRPNWERYTKIVSGVIEEAPAEIKALGEINKHFYAYLSDSGITHRFYPEELVSGNLTIEKVNSILRLLSIKRLPTDFIYYTSTKPGNPLFDNPIIYIDDGLYQVFEVKQVIHAIDTLLEKICSESAEETSKLTDKKGSLLEFNIIKLFKTLFIRDYEYFEGYYVDGCEQDILFLWKDYAFIIEAKGYKLNEPFRDPNRAFIRIKRDFKESIGYGYQQTKRVEKYFVEQTPLKITDKNGKLIKEIDTSKYKERDFSIIVNLKSFGQIQNDLSLLLEVDEEDKFPWAIKLDDLEVFFLTLRAKHKNPYDFIDFLINREMLHNKLICSDELEVIGGYLTEKINMEVIEENEIISTHPDLTKIFDEQYNKGMGFYKEKYWKEKRSGKYIFW